MFRKLVLVLTMLTVTAHAVFGCGWHHVHEHTDAAADRELPAALADGLLACLSVSENDGHADHADADHNGPASHGSASTGSDSHDGHSHPEGPTNHEPHDCASCVFTRPQAVTLWSPGLVWTTFTVVASEVQTLPIITCGATASGPLDAASIRVRQQVWRI